MRRLERNPGTERGDGGYNNVGDYIAGLQAAIRTHQRLTSNSPLRLEVREDGRIPLAQRILLR